MNCAESSKAIFNQIRCILDQIEDVDYQRPLSVFNGSTLGQHFRHILDFYQCIAKGGSHGLLDYNRRDRSPAVERFTEEAAHAFAEIETQIDALDDQRPLEVVTDFHTDPSMDRNRVKSSVGRELMYAYDHAVHHLAIIKIGLKTDCAYVQLDEHVGVAPSTIKFRAAHQQ